MNNYNYPQEDDNNDDNAKTDPPIGSLWYDSEDDNKPYIIIDSGDRKYAISLVTGNVYTNVVDDGPFGGDHDDFKPLKEPVTITPKD